ncbi:hypothetical protein QEM42_003044 [Pseudomonas putida]|uniref:Uncharacterized protein n=1 Tax=Pseudomonas putida TaxID=303 RepID=A0A7D5W047_PSEPU|nr:hypothetical protein [Pseudomonas putida]EKT4561850.1 hypothetical protein [Pseudomonas putida]MBS5848460.1 hypothetical protein [Pseudomonas putida]QLJ16231.1 hypothetical protein H0H12_10035 [Pseudomonas putida]
MNYWDSYDYPEGDPKVRITFGAQHAGTPVVAWLGLYGKTVVPPKVNVEAEYSIHTTDEAEARRIMNAHADDFIRERNIGSVVGKP